MQPSINTRTQQDEKVNHKTLRFWWSNECVAGTGIPTCDNLKLVLYCLNNNLKNLAAAFRMRTKIEPQPKIFFVVNLPNCSLFFYFTWSLILESAFMKLATSNWAALSGHIFEARTARREAILSEMLAFQLAAFFLWPALNDKPMNLLSALRKINLLSKNIIIYIKQDWDRHHNVLSFLMLQENVRIISKWFWN